MREERNREKLAEAFTTLADAVSPTVSPIRDEMIVVVVGAAGGMESDMLWTIAPDAEVDRNNHTIDSPYGRSKGGGEGLSQLAREKGMFVVLCQSSSMQRRILMLIWLSPKP